MQTYNYDPYAAQPPEPTLLGLDSTMLWYAIGGALLAAFALFAIVQFLRAFLFIARPNEVLVFSGQRNKTDDGQDVGYRIVKAGQRAVRIPILEIVSRLDMTVIPVDVVVQNAYSRGNIPLEIHAIANVKIHSEEKILRNAVERFVNKSRQEIELVAQQTLEGALREVLAQLTPEEVNEDRLKFAEKLIHAAEDDLQILGLQLDTLKIQSVSDSTGYLDSIGRPKIAAALRDAENAESQANQEIQQAQATATQNAELARTTAQTSIQTKQNELRQIRAQLEGQAQAVEREAEAAAKTARAMAERDLQSLRAQLEQRRLHAEVVIPSEFQRQAQAIIAKGLAAPTVENGLAANEVLAAMSDAWTTMGPQAREIYVVQHLDQIVGSVVHSLGSLDPKDVHVIDGGDGNAIAGYAASYPKMVGAVMSALRDSTGIDVPALISGKEGAER
ncbi:MAG: flotillin family protein [Deltaproteobacteria bacterium]|nr:flotillin family protein [Deltaproteobacteria bacterium]